MPANVPANIRIVSGGNTRGAAMWQTLEEWDADGSLYTSYVYGNYIDEVLSMRKDIDGAGTIHDVEDYYFHQDDLFNVVLVTDSAGDAAERYEYGDYGAPFYYTGGGSSTAYSAINSTRLFNGREWDDESRFYHYRTRYLEPTMGRFTTRDTIGVWGDGANVGNGLAIAGSNCLNRVDVFGQQSGQIFPGVPMDWGDLPWSHAAHWFEAIPVGPTLVHEILPAVAPARTAYNVGISFTGYRLSTMFPYMQADSATLGATYIADNPTWHFLHDFEARSMRAAAHDGAPCFRFIEVNLRCEQTGCRAGSPERLHRSWNSTVQFQVVGRVVFGPMAYSFAGREFWLPVSCDASRELRYLQTDAFRRWLCGQ